MKTRQTAVCGILTLIFALAFATLVTGCKDSIDSPDPTLTGITAVYNGTAAIYPTTPLDNLKTGLTVTAAYSNGTTQTVTGYALSGTLTVGASVITVTYKGKTTTFTVPVTVAPNDDITYTATQSGGADGVTDSNGITFTFSESIDSLNLTAADITVGGTATKGTAELSGSGTSWTLPITVSVAGHTTVKIIKTGIEAEVKNVTVYKAGQIAPTLTGITAVYTGTATIYPAAPLDNLKTDLTVTAAYSDSTTQTVTDYALSGTLAVGTSTITVSYEGKTTTFTVTVTAPTLTGITAVYTGTAAIYPTTPLDNLKTGLTVTAAYSDSTTQTVTDYALSGTLAVGTSTITVSYEGKTTTFTVTVTAPTLTGITAVYNGTEPVYPTTPLDDLKTDLTVTAAYNDGTTQTVTGYALTGTLTVGTSTVTVTYEGKTTAFEVIVEPFTETVSLVDLATFLSGKAANTKEEPIGISIQLETAGDFATLKTILDAAADKYVYLNLKGSAVTSIPAEAFKDCAALASITIPDTITIIGYEAFSGCASLINVNIEYGVTRINFGAFENCTSLVSVTIPDSVSNMGGAEVFCGCTSLTSVTIPNSVRSIGNTAFARCASLTSVTLPTNPGFTKIDEYLFYECTSLAGITIPASVTSIELYAFLGCTSLTSITIPANVTAIKGGAFRDCTSLTSVTFESGSTVITDTAFPPNDGTNSFNPLGDAYNGTAGTYTRSPGGSTWTRQ